MDGGEEQDTYVSQLREVFDSCDESRTGFLSKDELHELCDKLQLRDQTGFFVKRLLEQDPDARVEFSEFKNCFVSLLTQSISNSSEYQNDSTGSNTQKNRSSSDREVSPKFVLGQKKYGRRSRPESSSAADTDNDVQSDFSEGDVLSVSYGPNNDDVNIELTESVFQLNQDEPVPTTPSRSRLLNKNSTLSRSESNRSITSSIDRKSETFEIEGPNSEFGDSDISSTYHGDNEEQYLRGIWRKLGVGKDGYLDLPELTIVCQHIGMDKMPDDIVTQLFEKLDSDQDGKVSFEEFLQGLFQHGFSPGSPENSVLSDVCCLPIPKAHKQPVRKFNVEVSEERKGSVSGVVVSYCGIFSLVDPDHSGFCEAGAICELWESLGLNGGLHLLRSLGFNTNTKINLQDLTDIFEEELQSNEHTDVYHYAVASYLNEMQHVKSNFEQVRTERDKLKGDLIEANTRAAILAQEVDDHHAKLEQSSQNKIIVLDKKYQDHIKSLQLELEREREQVACHESVLRQQFCGEIELIKEDDAKTKDELAYVKKENNRLEKELADLVEKHEELSRLNSLHQKELDSLAELRQKMVDLESGHNYIQSQHYQSLLDELENAREETQELKDRNDELSMEVESLRRKLTSNERPSKRHKKSGSWLDDYNKSSPPLSLKRRESGSSTEEGICNSDEEPVIGKVRKRVSLSSINSDKTSIEVETLKEHHKEEIEKLRIEFDQAIIDLQDSYDVQLIKLNSQPPLKSPSDNFNENKCDSMAEIKKLSSELQNVNQKLEKQINVNDEAKKMQEVICKKLNNELEYQNKLLVDTERNHMADKNELITRLEKEHEEKLEQVQNEWYQRLEELRQESGDELDSVLKKENEEKQFEKVTESVFLEQLEEQKLAMKRKYKNLKSQLSVTTEELEMALAREAQAEKLHTQLEKRCLEVEERLVKMASGLDTSSETSAEFANNLSNDDQQEKNKPMEVIVMENTQLRRRNALFVTRCEVLERSLHAAKAREYFGSEFHSSDADEKTRDEFQPLELLQKIENLEMKLHLSEQELQISKADTEKFWKLRLEEETKNLQKLSCDLNLRCTELQTTVQNLQNENSNMIQLYDKTKMNDVCLKSSEELTGKLKEDFDRCVSIQVNQLWQQILQGGEAALAGQLKEDFNNMLYRAVHKIEESIRNQYNEEHEKIQHHLIEENNKIKESLTRDKKMMQLNYEEQLNSLKKVDITHNEPNRTDMLLKNLFVENASLVKALQIVEERQLKAEQSNLRLQKKCRMLSKVLSDVTRAAVS